MANGFDLTTGAFGVNVNPLIRRPLDLAPEAKTGDLLLVRARLRGEDSDPEELSFSSIDSWDDDFFFLAADLVTGAK